MNKSELIEKMATKSGLTKADSGRALDAFTETVTAELSTKDGSVALVGFGTFKTSNRSARKGRNPQTGAAIDIPAATVPKFSAGKALKDAVK